jgi:hypothetical protein
MMIKVRAPTFILLIALALLAPFVYLWALNTLFPVLQLEYSFVNYIAICVVHAFLRADIGIRKNEQTN